VAAVAERPAELRPFALKPREWAAPAALVLLSLALHLRFRMHGLGEQDEARFIITTLSWREAGSFPLDTGVNLTSPLYLLYLRSALDAGLSPVALVEHLNLINVATGTAALVPLFLLFRVLTADVLTALLASLSYWFVPAFWYGNGYGMAHIPALLFLLASLVVFADAQHRSGWAFTLRSLLAVVSMSLAAGLKSDILACGLAFPALTACVGASSRRNLLVALAIPAVATASVLIVSRCFLWVPESLTASASSWSEKFPFDARALVAPEHWKITVDSLGSVFWWAAGIGLAVGLAPGHPPEVTRRLRRLVVFVIAWAVPTVLFWSLIWAHAARHLTAALCPVPLLIAVGITTLQRQPLRAILALVALIGLNYDSGPATDHPNRAGPRLFESRAQMQRLADRLSHGCEQFSENSSSRKLLLGYWAIPYCEFALLTRAVRFERTVTTSAVSWDLELWLPGRPTTTSVRVRREPPPRSIRAAPPGWFAWDAERARSVP